MLFLGALLVAALGEVSLQVSSAQSGPGIKEDMGIYPEPSPRPALPSPGGKLTDPTFGTEILRVTGPADCFDPGCGTYYSHWPTFNLDNTKLLIRNGETGHAIIKDFNPATFTVSAGKTDLPITIQNSNCTNCPAGTYTGPTWESATWSNLYPNLIFTYPSWYHSGGALQLYSYDIQTAQFTLVADLNSASGGNPAIARFQQMYMSANDDVFCWLQKRQGFTDAWGFTVYKRSTNQILFNEPDVYDGEINEVHVDKSGKWLHIVIPTAQPDGTGTRILNLQTGQYQPMVHSVDRTPGHGDMGTETIVGVNIYEAGLTARHLSDVHSFQQIFNYKTIEGNSDWTKDLHGSLLANDEGWITIGTYVDWDAIAGGLTNYHLMDNEIAQIATDGTGRVRRLAHTHSIIAADEAPGQTLSGIAPKPSNGYTAMPKPTISKDGKYIAFTSNWGNSDRYDLFILKVPPPAGNSLSLDGTNDYVLVNDNASLDVAGPVTVEAWFKIDSVGSYETIVSKEAFQVSGTGGGYELQVTNTGKLRGNFYQSHNT
ncbi:MAG TPA: LamG-like jellyroll fold domain-containing protein, partial [Pyrinomonadaceae bacterium]|nr:LamG-like jellyroll fold domain-containing protein [Pyrinomonadaceae bacterium]